jgi:hypothetical protein
MEPPLARRCFGYLGWRLVQTQIEDHRNGELGKECQERTSMYLEVAPVGFVSFDFFESTLMQRTWSSVQP